MQHGLDPLPLPHELFDYRREVEGPIPVWLPYNQGDVFEGVQVPGLEYGQDGPPPLAMLFMHPCTMRTRSGRLEPRLTVVRVSWRSRKTLGGTPYFDSPKLLPLPDLLGNGQTFQGNLMEMGVVRSEELARSRRVAVLGQAGRLTVLQRLIFHLTRFPAPLDRLDEATRDVQMEIELQTDWVESVARRGGGLTPEQVDLVEAEFDAFLSKPAEDANEDRDNIRSRLSSPDDDLRSDTITYVRIAIDSGSPGACLLQSSQS